MSGCRCDRIKNYIVGAGGHRCPHDVDIWLHKNMSPVPSRCVRKILASSFIARAWSRSKIARVIRCSVVGIKRTVDMSPLKRIRLHSHAASELKANKSMRARERRAIVGIAQVSGPKQIDRLRECKWFLSCLLCCQWRAPPSSRSGGCAA